MSEASCRVCGCTETNACNPPCAWFEPTLCTSCALAAEALREWARAAVRPSLARLLGEAGIARRVIDTSDANLILNISRMLNERASHIAEHADTIGTRVELNGRWQNLMLSEMPAAAALREGFRLLLHNEPEREALT